MQELEDLIMLRYVHDINVLTLLKRKEEEEEVEEEVIE